MPQEHRFVFPLVHRHTLAVTPVELWARPDPHDKESDGAVLECIERLGLATSYQAALRLFPDHPLSAQPAFNFSPVLDPKRIGEASAQLTGLLLTVAVMANTRPGELRCAARGKVWASGSVAIGDGWLQDLPLTEMTRAKVRAFFADENAQLLLLPANTAQLAQSVAAEAGARGISCMRVSEFEETAVDSQFWSSTEANHVVVFLTRGRDDLRRLASSILGMGTDESPIRHGETRTNPELLAASEPRVRATMDFDVQKPAPVTIPVNFDIVRQGVAPEAVETGKAADDRATSPQPTGDTTSGSSSDDVAERRRRDDPPTIAGEVAAWMRFLRYALVLVAALVALAVTAYSDPANRRDIEGALTDAREFLWEPAALPTFVEATLGVSSPSLFGSERCVSATVSLHEEMARGATLPDAQLLGVAARSGDRWVPLGLFFASNLPEMHRFPRTVPLGGCIRALGDSDTNPDIGLGSVEVLVFPNAQPPAIVAGWVPSMLGELDEDSGLIVMRGADGLPPPRDHMYDLRPFAEGSVPVTTVGAVWTYGPMGDGFSSNYYALRLTFEPEVEEWADTFLMTPIAGLRRPNGEINCDLLSIVREDLDRNCTDLTLGPRRSLCTTVPQQLASWAEPCASPPGARQRGRGHRR